MPTFEQESLLDEVQRRACLYFLDHADPATGLVRDRARMEGREERHVSSIAATGFGLSALCIASERGYIQRDFAMRRVERTLTHLAKSTAHRSGFFPHFLDMRTGQRIWGCEFSSVDTAWLICGVLHCREAFESSRIKNLAGELYGRIDWPWMLNGGATLSHGWTPEAGFLPSRWNEYAELLAMYLLAIGSREHPIPASSWDAWERPLGTYEGITYIDPAAPLFVHQYSHAWFDFRGKRDGYADYFQNSKLATEAHRLFCMGQDKLFPWYGSDMWGVTASDSRVGYSVWGSPSLTEQPDGTLVPCASGGSVPFMPYECCLVLQNMLNRYGNNVWGRYGFVDAFNPLTDWYDPDVVGIDTGITMLMAENARSGFVWDTFMKNPEAQRGMDSAGFKPYES